MMRKIGILIIIMIVFSMSVLGCGSNKPELNVYNFGDYIDRDIITDFEKEFDVKVNYREFDTNEEMYIKLKSGAGDFDVICSSDYMIEKMIKEDMLEKVDVNELSNFKHIDPSFTSLDYDKENEYSVPYFWGTVGILYNETMVTEPVDSWDILFDENYSKQILMMDSQRDALAVALKRLGYSLNTTDEEELNQATQMLIDQKPLVLAYVMDEVKNMMIQGEASLAVAYSGEAIDILDGTDDVRYVVPKEGSNLWFDCMSILKTSSQKELGMEFINYLLDPDVALTNTEYVGYSTPNATAYEMLDDEIKLSESYYPPKDIIDNCEVYIDLGEFNDLYSEMWLDVKAAQ